VRQVVSGVHYQPDKTLSVCVASKPILEWFENPLQSVCKADLIGESQLLSNPLLVRVRSGLDQEVLQGAEIGGGHRGFRRGSAVQRFNSLGERKKTSLQKCM